MKPYRITDAQSAEATVLASAIYQNWTFLDGIHTFNFR